MREGLVLLYPIDTRLQYPLSLCRQAIPTTWLSFVFLLVEQHTVLQTVRDPIHGPVIAFGLAAVVLGVGTAVWCNYFYGKVFSSTVICITTPLVGLAYLFCLMFDHDFSLQPIGTAFKAQLWLALATLLIVANTIRLGVFARRDELEILSLVGASRLFVNTPFLLEGLLQGAAGGLFALLLLYALFRLVLPGFEFGLAFVMGGISPRFFGGSEALALVFSGAALGLLGSGAALAGDLRR